MGFPLLEGNKGTTVKFLQSPTEMVIWQHALIAGFPLVEGYHSPNFRVCVAFL